MDGRAGCPPACVAAAARRVEAWARGGFCRAATKQARVQRAIVGFWDRRGAALRGATRRSATSSTISAARVLLKGFTAEAQRRRAETKTGGTGFTGFEKRRMDGRACCPQRAGVRRGREVGFVALRQNKPASSGRLQGPRIAVAPLCASQLVAARRVPPYQRREFS
jgi:hypothetical protein